MTEQVLVAVDWENSGRSPEPVLDFLREHDALVAHEVGWQAHWKTGETQPVHRFRFDAGKVRNTEVHGVGFRAGFVVHVESGPGITDEARRLNRT